MEHLPSPRGGRGEGGEGYLQAAAAWLPYAEQHWHPYPGRPDAGYFGTGTVAIQSLEAVAQHAFICATLFHASAYGPAGALPRATLRERALAGLRYLAETHLTGGLGCVDLSGAVAEGHRQWGGDGWTSVPAFFLWLAADALGDALPAAESEAVHRVLAFEADANLAEARCTVLEHHGYFREVPPIPTGRFGVSWPESNAWRGALLASALLALPDHPHAARWRDSLERHFVNALSVPQDATSDEIVDGQPVRERFAGANVHPHFALEHHGFFHPCYAARTMEFMVLAAEAFERHGRPAPDCTRHHLLDEWAMLRRLILWQGRLAYPAGKDHHRYGWGLTYLLPVAAWLHRRGGDAVAASLEDSLAALFLSEQRHNGDGSFARERMGALLASGAAADGPGLRQGGRSRVLYYRAEADPPFYLLLTHRLHAAADRAGRPAVPPASPAGLDRAAGGTFEEPDAGLVLRRDPARFVSWSWNAYPDVAQGLFIPRDGDHLVEWNGNLAPTFLVQDVPPAPRSRAVAWRRTCPVEGGFATLGLVRHAEGALLEHVLFAALPDGRSAIYASEVRAAWELTLLYQEGLRFNLGNDLFNGYTRRLRFEGGDADLAAGGLPHPALTGNPSTWLEVDGMLGVEFCDGAGEPWTVRTFPYRNATDRSAWYAVLCRPLHAGPRPFAAGALVQRTCARLVALSPAPDAPPIATWRTPARCAWGEDGAALTLTLDVTGLDGKRYHVAADWAARTACSFAR